MTDFCEYENELYVSKICGEFFEYLSNSSFPVETIFQIIFFCFSFGFSNKQFFNFYNLFPFLYQFMHLIHIDLIH